MPFNPQTEYTVNSKEYQLKDFFDFFDEFITRPPYQRKNVWSTSKKQALLDSLFRKYYIPKIVIREVRLNSENTVNEVVDGQQRIITAQEFFANKLKLPSSLKDIHPDLPGKYHKDLNSDLRRFIDRELTYSADIIKGIENPMNPKHQKVATEIFWRLQQGESLNFMEIAHARLASLVRNFVVKYADDITFNFDEYKSIDSNINKHKFFDIYRSDNNRMQHLLLLTRILMLETSGGPTELKDSAVSSFIDDSIVEDGVGNYSYESKPIAKKVLSNLTAFYEIFKDDPMLDDKTGLKELNRDYVVLSFYLLLRHLREYYVFGDAEKTAFRNFLLDVFYPRWSSPKDEDNDILMFSTSRQMDQKSIEERDQVLRQMFFEYMNINKTKMKLKDIKRTYNEAQKIAIYRRDKGLCAICLKEGKSEKDALVSWSQYEADHIQPHSKGGQTETHNAQVLCRYHNRVKSNNR